MSKPASVPPVPIQGLETLKRRHPEAYEAWVAEGVNQERARIRSHLQMAKLTPEGTLGLGLKAALKAIECGAPVDAEAMANYTEFAVNQRDINNRNSDDQAAMDAVLGVATPSADDNSLGAQVARRFEELTGVQRG